MIDRLLEPKNDYYRVTEYPSLTRADPKGYNIKIRSKRVERWF